LSVYERVRGAVERGERAVVFTVLEGEGLGRKLFVPLDGEPEGMRLPRWPSSRRSCSSAAARRRSSTRA
jgi:hypothetical protein